MLYINEIQNLLKCDNAMAWNVFHNMLIDFSECTIEEFEREARWVYNRLAKAR
jgi:hypothetical protein